MLAYETFILVVVALTSWCMFALLFYAQEEVVSLWSEFELSPSF